MYVYVYFYWLILENSILGVHLLSTTLGWQKLPSSSKEVAQGNIAYYFLGFCPFTCNSLIFFLMIVMHLCGLANLLYEALLKFSYQAVIVYDMICWLNIQKKVWTLCAGLFACLKHSEDTVG